MRNSLFLALFALAVLQSPASAAATKVVVFKSPACECCQMWVGYMRKGGFDVRVRDLEDVTPVKEYHGVPEDFWSCHTAIIGRYVVEGHVPIEATRRMLSERPGVKGIALPGMLVGSPGMPGEKTEKFVIYGFSGSKRSVFMEF